ncbi:MAG: DEAD/DEAH box helicase family protein, partial [bacterium]|nr:DEAD/DEAH box helicase family protein [bacterium]
MSARAVEVAIPVPVEQTFRYALPEGTSAEPGVRVLVPYGSRRLVGVVVAGVEPLAFGGRKLKSVLQILDAEPVLPAPLIEIILRAARDALCPPGTALAAAIPPGTAPRPGRRVQLESPGRRALERGEARGTLGKVLWALGKRPLPESTLRSRFPAAVPALDHLERVGWVSRELATEPPRVKMRTERVYRIADGVDVEAARENLLRAPRRLEIFEQLLAQPAPLRASAALRALREDSLVSFDEREVMRGEQSSPMTAPEEIPELTPHQREAVAEIVTAIDERMDDTFLLYGITGSGKTEVYLRATQKALESERQSIILVPEISLTHQLVDRFRARFGDRVAVLHSGLSAGERFDQWRRIREGSVPIAIGARSA